MLKTGDVVKHKDSTFMGTGNPLIGIVENADVSKVCHVRTCSNIRYSSTYKLYVMEHEIFSYGDRDHLESHWELLC